MFLQFRFRSDKFPTQPCTWLCRLDMLQQKSGRRVTIRTNETSYATSVLHGLHRMKNERKHCDFLIKVGTLEIPAHKNVLSSGSDYFDRMLSHDTQENQTGVVEMKDVDAECVDISIEFLYTGVVVILENKCTELIHVAKLMQLPLLCEAILNFLADRLSQHNFFETKKLANFYGCKELEEACIKFSEENLPSLSSSEVYGELEACMIENALRSENSKVSGDEKLDALLRWIIFDPNRKALFPELLQCIDLIKVSVDRRRDLLKEPLLAGNSDCLKAVSVSILDTLNGTNLCNKAVIGVLDHYVGKIWSYDPVRNDWEEKFDFPIDDLVEDRHFDVSIVALDNYMYAFLKDEVYRYKYTSNRPSWERMADISDDHGHSEFCLPPIAVVGGRIFVIGGGHISIECKAVSRYNPVTNSWAKMPNKPLATGGASILPYEKDIYCFGGFLARAMTGQTRRVFRFDTSNLVWSEVQPMREPRVSTAAAQFEDKIYVFGGCIDNEHLIGSVEMYSPSANTWTYICHMERMRRCAKAFVFDGDAYIVGGAYRCGFTEYVEKYNFASKTWKIVTLPTNAGSVRVTDSFAINF